MKALFAAAMLLASATPAFADELLVGKANAVNCLPFGCATSANNRAYQQVYASSAFSGPVTISAISFFVANQGASDQNVLDIAFYTSARGVNQLTTDLASNRGTLLGNFGTFSVPGSVPDTLTFTGTAFSYDPSVGNLLMDVRTVSGAGIINFGPYFQADDTGTVMSRALNGDYQNTDSYGLVTQFTTSAAGGVPEPASWAMMIGGFGAVGGTLRRRRTGAARVLA